MLRSGQHLNLELFEYEVPNQLTSPPRNSDVGGHHLAFYVDDIEASYEYLKSVPGVAVQTGPNGMDADSPIATQRWFYFQAPWGLQMEMVNCSTGDNFAGLAGELQAPPTATWR